jgi:hypothetical protein
MFRKARFLLAAVFLSLPVVSWGQVAVPDSHHVHRQRLIGSRAKAGMFHASILYFHSDPVRKLDFILAKQNAEEISHALDLIEKNTQALQQEVSLEISQGDKEILAEDIRGTLDTCLKCRTEVNALSVELRRVLPDQEAVHKHAQVLFHLMKKILAYHQSAEAKFGIQPTPDPPEPKD